MSWVLAVQPDTGQADVLREALRTHIADRFVIAGSLEEALSLIDQDAPDLILLPILMPAAAEHHLLAYLGTNPGARHVQVLGLPRLQHSVAGAVQPPRRSLFPWRRRPEPRLVSAPACDPAVFTQDVVAYLATARTLRHEVALYGALSEERERRREPRFANDDVPWISFVTFGGETATLINVSARGALLRTHSRPAYHLLRRSAPHIRHQAHLTLEVESDGDIHATGRVIRCVPLRTGAAPHYEVAFSFDDSVGLHLPGTDALVSALADIEDVDLYLPATPVIRRGD
jgi:hypothetical protein